MLIFHSCQLFLMKEEKQKLPLKLGFLFALETCVVNYPHSLQVAMTAHLDFFFCILAWQICLSSWRMLRKSRARQARFKINFLLPFVVVDYTLGLGDVATEYCCFLGYSYKLFLLWISHAVFPRPVPPPFYISELHIFFLLVMILISRGYAFGYTRAIFFSFTVLDLLCCDFQVWH